MALFTRQRIRFGPFELDTKASELYKHDLKLRVQGYPIEILAMLLERPCELITREEIQQKLWPTESETFVDFEHGLNTQCASCGRRWAMRQRLRSTSRPAATRLSICRCDQARGNRRRASSRAAPRTR